MKKPKYHIPIWDELIYERMSEWNELLRWRPKIVFAPTSV